MIIPRIKWKSNRKQWVRRKFARHHKIVTLEFQDYEMKSSGSFRRLVHSINRAKPPRCIVNFRRFANGYRCNLTLVSSKIVSKYRKRWFLRRTAERRLCIPGLSIYIPCTVALVVRHQSLHTCNRKWRSLFFRFLKFHYLNKVLFVS